MRRGRLHRVAVLASPGMGLFELSTAIEVFGLPRPELDVPWWYAVDVVAIKPGRQETLGGAELLVRSGLETLTTSDTVIVPGWPADTEVAAAVVTALRDAHARGARLVSICSGAFALAATGLLDGRRAATHWKYAEKLAERFPAVAVDPGVLYVDEGNILTSAGSAAGIDLCLYLIRRDHGADVANQVARRMVMAPHRDGDQAQFVERPVPRLDDARIHDVIRWMEENLVQNVDLADLSARAHLSPRQFSRRFRTVTGESPWNWLVGQRVAASLPHLDSGDDTIERIAVAVGFNNATTFRHHFRARMHVSPQGYRRAFRARADNS